MTFIADVAYHNRLVDRFEHLDELAGGEDNDRRVRFRRRASVMVARGMAWAHLNRIRDLLFEADCARDLPCFEGNPEGSWTEWRAVKFHYSIDEAKAALDAYEAELQKPLLKRVSYDTVWFSAGLRYRLLRDEETQEDHEAT
jgi:hypothetical protein